MLRSCSGELITSAWGDSHSPCSSPSGTLVLTRCPKAAEPPGKLPLKQTLGVQPQFDPNQG